MAEFYEGWNGVWYWWEPDNRWRRGKVVAVEFGGYLIEDYENPGFMVTRTMEKIRRGKKPAEDWRPGGVVQSR
jgi:hypothetical protein